MAIPGGKPCPGSGADIGFPEGGESKPDPVPGSSRLIPGPWWIDRGGRGGPGGVFPSPPVGTHTFLSGNLRRRATHTYLSGTSTPPGLRPPSPEGGSAWEYPGKTVPGDANSRTVRNTIDDLLC